MSGATAPVGAALPDMAHAGLRPVRVRTRVPRVALAGIEYLTQVEGRQTSALAVTRFPG